MYEKVVLNQQENVTNIVTYDDLVIQVNNTLDILIEHLEKICGPFTRDTLLLRYTDLSKATNDTVDRREFIHDGIKIVEKIFFASPVQQYIRNLVAYIGKCVDRVSHDGTTSSMLLMCYILKNIFKDNSNSTLVDKFKDYKHKQYVETLSINDYSNIFNDFISKLKIYTNQYLIKTNDPVFTELGVTENEVAAFIAFLQAYTSSNKDLEIANAIRDYYLNTPKQFWSDVVYFEQSGVEEDYKVKLEMKEYELVVKSIPISTFNKLKRTEDGLYHVREKTDIIMFQSDLADSSDTTRKLLQYIHSSDRPLVILVPTVSNMGMGNTVSEKIMGYTYLDPDNPDKVLKDIVAVGYQTDTTLRYPDNFLIKTIAHKYGVPVWDGQDKNDQIEDFIIKDAKVVLTTHDIRFDNITPMDEEAIEAGYKQLSLKDDYSIIDKKTNKTYQLVKNIHPGEFLPEKYPLYHKQLDILRNAIAWHKKQHAPDETIINAMSDAISHMQARKLPHLKIGGTLHDSLRLRSVLEDAAGAAMVAINSGIYLNAFDKLSFAMEDHYSEDQKLYASPLGVHIHELLHTSVNEVRKSIGTTMSDIDPNYNTKSEFTVYELCKDGGPHYCYDNMFVGVNGEDANPSDFKWAYMDVQQQKQRPFTSSEKYYTGGSFLELIKEYFSTNSQENIDLYKNLPPTTPGAAIEELLIRLNDLCPKLMTTDNLIVEGAIWSK